MAAGFRIPYSYWLVDVRSGGDTCAGSDVNDHKLPGNQGNKGQPGEKSENRIELGIFLKK